ncbi:coiled-coil domain-containing protein 173-like [Drosophila busckii]|uniref:coiled-coil domain-containing protein 173-like n=1 Tax=Drosophila busckii TaxID=30019 RepID=UPI00083ED8E2|nr:coiled-coil domain-containing protein 173-like [Drosophila busckii]
MSKKQDDPYYDTKRMARLDFSSVRATQISCVLRVMNEALERVKISLILPRLLGDTKLLAKVLTGTIYAPGLRLVDDFVRRRNIILKEQRPPLMDHGMIKIIDFFQRNHPMYKLFPKFMNELTLAERKLLSAFENLHDIAQHHIERNAKKHIAQERRMYKIYQENETVKANIDDLQARLQAEKVRLRWKIAAKEAYMKKCQDELNIKIAANDLRIQRESDRCRRLIRANQKASTEKFNDLQETLQKVRAEHQKQTKEFRKYEKDTRAEKNKLMLQLEAVIKKYDQSIGEKMRENFELEEEMKVAQREVDAFMKTYHREEAIYKAIVIKREEEEQKRKLRRIMIYMMNLAARKIQRYWRKWRRDQAKKNKRLSRAINKKKKK